jgi:gamma-glutamyltranspeptidase/glutathione hydrolase
VWDDPAALRLRIEGHAPEAWARDLAALGHDVELVGAFDSRLGHAHVITVEADHLAGAADPRSLGGSAIGW